MAVLTYPVTNGLSWSVNDQNGNCSYSVDSPVPIRVKLIVNGTTVETTLAAGTYSNNIPGAKSTFRTSGKSGNSVPTVNIYTWSVT